MPENHRLFLDFKNLNELPPPLKWEIEPLRWSLGESGLKVETYGKTDFWQKTHYGMQADSGNFLGISVEEKNFSLSTRVRYRGRNEFDQAGLMVRISPLDWIKTSVEYQPGTADKLGAVVTNLGYSDWSCQDFANPGCEIILRIRAERPDFVIEYMIPGGPGEWKLIRVAHLHKDHEDIPLLAGIYCCSPREDGFLAEFDWLELERTAV